MRRSLKTLLGVLLLMVAQLLIGCTSNSLYYQGSLSVPASVSGTRIFGRDAVGGPTLDLDLLIAESGEKGNTEEYDSIVENDFLNVLSNPQSTFSIDVDTASYSNVRRMINEKTSPPRGSVRIEEFVNYFSYDYPQPKGDHPFSVSTDIAKCPWQPNHQLVRIGIQGKEFPLQNRPPCNLVFLLDVSGSMEEDNKLPLVKKSIQLLLNRLDERDSVAICVYAGKSGTVLPPTNASNKSRIAKAIRRLKANGSTNGGAGIKLAYKHARENFIENGVNRVILCTDGDFNVGVTNRSDLIDLIQDQAQTNVFLSVLGFGSGNYRDGTMEYLADKGNGNYACIDSMLEARKIFVNQLTSTLVTIAKDVKIQVDFNPNRIQSYRLIGYENRMLNNEDFDNDEKDAGEIGAGHSVTALYELVPVGIASPVAKSLDTEFVETKVKEGINPDTILKVALRYKLPEESSSQEFEARLIESSQTENQAVDSDFQFAEAVASFGMLLRESKYSGSADLDWVLRTAKANLGRDKYGFRNEFIQLVEKAKRLLE